MRLIDADALVRDLEVWYCDECDRNLDCVHGRDCPIYDETTHIHEAETVDAVPIKPLAAALAWYAMPPVHPKGLSPADLAEAWEEFLRGQTWWQRDEESTDITCGECAVPHNEWTGCPKLGGKIPPESYSCGQGERI